MAQQPPQGDLLGRLECVVRQLPAHQVVVDLGIEGDGPVLHETHDAGSRDALADRSGLEEGLLRDRFQRVHVLDPVDLDVVELEVIDHRDAGARDVEVLQQDSNVGDVTGWTGGAAARREHGWQDDRHSSTGPEFDTRERNCDHQTPRPEEPPAGRAARRFPPVGEQPEGRKC